MTAPSLSWQGIGISSDPNQHDEPLSLHLLAYLKEASAFSDIHRIVIADALQVTNYTSLHNLPQDKALRVARRKGRKKGKDIARICRAEGLSNIEIMLWEEARQGHEEIFEKVYSLYQAEPQVRQDILSVVPRRLRDKAQNLDVLASYAIEEIAAILSFPGIKIGHDKERGYDRIAAGIHDDFGIGKRPSFHYSGLGLEYVPATGRKVEPYSSYADPSRILLTDSRRSFGRKLRSAREHPRSYLRLAESLEDAWGSEPQEDSDGFYRDIIRPAFNALKAPARIARNVAAVALVSAALLAGGSYVHHDAASIRQQKIDEIPGFVFSGSPGRAFDAIQSKIREANTIIESRYHIPDYF
jgi:hypothetical protein